MNPAFKQALPDLTCGAAIVVLALAASFARQQGYVDQDSVLRLVIGANGLMIAWFGNRLPKAVAPGACARKVARFTGWSLVLSGLVYTGLWIFAPVQLAITLGTAAVAAGILATFAYCIRLRARSRTQTSR